MYKDLITANTDKDIPTILFWNTNTVKFNGNSIKEKAISGSETAIINLAKCMKVLGWNVFVFCDTPDNTDNVYDGVIYINFKLLEKYHKMIQSAGNYLIFMSVRAIKPFLPEHDFDIADKAMCFMEDMPIADQFSRFPEASNKMDYVLFVSQFQADTWQKEFNSVIPEEKIIITRNGLDEARFRQSEQVKKIRGKCVYTTTPFRGLDLLIIGGIWEEIKKQVPFATLHVYSGMSIYDHKEYVDTQAIFDYGKQIAEKNDIYFHEPVKQAELAKVLLESDVMLYPNHFPETSGITLIEASKARIPVISSKYGAIPETVKNGDGILIEPSSFSKEYITNFVNAAVKMLTDDMYRATFCTIERDLSWLSVAKEWDRFFRKIIVGGDTK